MNKTLLYYFTGTGNSQMICNNLAEKLKNNDNSVEIIPIIKVLNEPILNDIDTMGIIFPNYAFNAPHIVNRFLRKLDQSNIKINYLFIISNMGGLEGKLYNNIKKNFKNKKINSYFSIKMPFNYTPYHKRALSQNEKMEMFKDMNERLDYIVTILKEKRDYIKPSKSGFYKTYIIPGLIYKLAYPNINKMDKDFWINNKCNNCEICVKVCPVQNIKMGDSKPEWQHNCEQCYACFHWCPKNAIEWKDKTQGKERYNNPDFSWKELNT